METEKKDSGKKNVTMFEGAGTWSEYRLTRRPFSSKILDHTHKCSNIFTGR